MYVPQSFFQDTNHAVRGGFIRSSAFSRLTFTAVHITDVYFLGLLYFPLLKKIVCIFQKIRWCEMYFTALLASVLSFLPGAHDQALWLRVRVPCRGAGGRCSLPSSSPPAAVSRPLSPPQPGLPDRAGPGVPSSACCRVAVWGRGRPSWPSSWLFPPENYWVSPPCIQL